MLIVLVKVFKVEDGKIKLNYLKMGDKKWIFKLLLKKEQTEIPNIDTVDNELINGGEDLGDFKIIQKIDAEFGSIRTLPENENYN